MKRLIFTVAGLIVAIVLSFAWYQSVHAPEKAVNLVTVTLSGPDGQIIILEAELADDSMERLQGLMDRSSLPSGQGMVFVFDEPAYRTGRPEKLSFWMKNTLIPLDILYFDEQGKFVSRTTMSPCMTQDCPTYPSDKPASFALEVNAGEPQTEGVGEDWVLTIEGAR